MAVFENLPNFRQAGGLGLANKYGQRVKDGLLFRSSRTDFITVKDKALFQELGIKSIIDLRSQTEYERADGEKLLDDIFSSYVLKHGKIKKMKPSLRWGRKKGNSNRDDSDFVGYRYLVSMWTMKWIWYIFVQLNFILRWSSFLLLIIDWIFGSQLFVKLFVKLVINKQSISRQYVDLLEYNKPVIKDILQLLTQEENFPVLIHCAHGKDRTGVLIAVILSCLEVDEDIIINDFTESENGLACIRQRVYEEIVDRYGFRYECTQAKAQTMRDVLHEINKRYGSISEYLLTTNFTKDEQDKLKSVLLEA